MPNRLSLLRGNSSQMRGIYRGGASRVGLARHNTFNARFLDSGVSLLPRALTINGTTKLPTFWYNGSAANASSFEAEYGETLSIIGAGSAPNFNRPTCLLDGTQGVQFQVSGKNYKAASNSVYDIATEDFVLEFVITTGSDVTNATYPLWKSTPSEAIYALINAGLFRFALRSSSIDTIVSAGSVAANTTYHIMGFFDRSGSGVLYNNNTQGTAVAIPSATLANTDTFEIFQTPREHVLHSVAMWNFGAGGLDSHLQPALVAERFARLTGVHLDLHKGQGYPSTLTRATSAFLERHDDATGRTYSFMVGPNWPQVERVKWFGDTIINGLRGETAHTNTCTDSEDPSALTLTGLTQPGDTKKSTRVDYPLQGLYAATGAAATREVTFSDSPGSAYVHCFSIRIIPGDKEWVRLESSIGGTAVWVNFHLTGDGSIGTIDNAGGELKEYGIRAALNEDDETEYQIFIAYKGVSGAHTHRIVFLDSDDSAASPTAAGNNAYVGYVAGINHVYETQWPLSDVITSGGTATVNDTDIIFKGDDGNVANTRTGSLEMSFTPTDHPDVAAYAQNLYSINDGGDVNNRSESYWANTDGYISDRVNSTETGANANASTAQLSFSATNKMRKRWSDTDDSVHVALDGADVSALTLAGERVADDNDRVVLLDDASGAAKPILAWMRSLLIRDR